LENKFNDKIPDQIYFELIELFGQEKTEELLKTGRTDFKYLTALIFAEKFKRRFGIELKYVLTIIFVLWLIYIFLIK